MKKINKKLVLSITLLLVATNGYSMPQKSVAQNEDVLRNPFIPQIPKEITKPKSEDISKKAHAPSEEKGLFEGINLQLPETAKEIVIPSMVITGLVWNTNRPQAIINARVIDIGDSIANAEIVSINKSGIEILIEGQTIQLKQ